MADGDLMDLQEVLKALSIGEQDLQNMVAQGKLKAVRAGRTVKFRRPEVMSMRGGRSTEPTIIIPSKGPARKIDESAATVVPEAPAGGVVPVETQEISIEDEELEILPLEDEAAATQAEAPVAGGDEEVTISEEAAPAEEEAVEGTRAPGRRSSRVGSRRSGAAYVMEESPVWAGMVVVTMVVLLGIGSIFGVMLLKNYYNEKDNVRYVPTGLTSVAYDIFADRQQ
jgi:hypothetical protein